MFSNRLIPLLQCLWILSMFAGSKAQNCQYQYVQEPLTRLYCKTTPEEEVLVGCSVHSSRALRSVSRFEWYRSTELSNNQPQKIRPDSVRTLARSNNTHRTITNIVSVTASPGSQYWCRPVLSNGTLLQPSQALVILPEAIFDGYTRCRNDDIFSTVSNRCADRSFNDGQTPPNESNDNKITVTTTVIQWTECSTADDLSITSTSTRIISTATTAGINSQDSNSVSPPTPTVVTVTTTVSSSVSPPTSTVITGTTTVSSSVSPTVVAGTTTVSCSISSPTSTSVVTGTATTSNQQDLGLQIFLPLLFIAVVIIVVQLAIHAVFLWKLKQLKKSKLETHPTTSESEGRSLRNGGSFTSENSSEARASYISISPSANSYIYPMASSEPIASANESSSPEADYEITSQYVNHIMPHQYAPLNKESMDTPCTYSSTFSYKNTV